MTPAAERRLLQVAAGLACLVPLAAGGAGMLAGPAMLAGAGEVASADLDSHFRYLSGLLFGVGVGFAGCIPAIERSTFLFRVLAAVVVAGGLARLGSVAAVGWPGSGHVFGLAMELGAVPLLTLWQARVARRCG